MERRKGDGQSWLKQVFQGISNLGKSEQNDSDDDSCHCFVPTVCQAQF